MVAFAVDPLVVKPFLMGPLVMTHLLMGPPCVSKYCTSTSTTILLA